MGNGASAGLIVVTVNVWAASVLVLETQLIVLGLQDTDIKHTRELDNAMIKIPVS